MYIFYILTRYISNEINQNDYLFLNHFTNPTPQLYYRLLKQ